MWPFSDFEYDFRSSQSTAYLLIVSSDKIAKALIVWSISTSRTWYTWSFLKGLTCWYSSQILMKFQVKYSELFCRFSITNSLKWFWIGGLCQNIQLVLVFFKAPLLDLHFCCYTLMILLMKLIVILISMLRVSHTGAAGGGREGASYDFYPHPSKLIPPMGSPQNTPSPEK